MGRLFFGDIAPDTNNGLRIFLKKMNVQGRIIHALMLREILTRFGREILGFSGSWGNP